MGSATRGRKDETRCGLVGERFTELRAAEINKREAKQLLPA